MKVVFGTNQSPLGDENNLTPYFMQTLIRNQPIPTRGRKRMPVSNKAYCDWNQPIPKQGRKWRSVSLSFSPIGTNPSPLGDENDTNLNYPFFFS